jgi:hypothetical protein
MQGTGAANFEKKGKTKGYQENAEQARKRNIRMRRERLQKRRMCHINPENIVAADELK